VCEGTPEGEAWQPCQIILGATTEQNQKCRLFATLNVKEYIDREACYSLLN